MAAMAGAGEVWRCGPGGLKGQGVKGVHSFNLRGRDECESADVQAGSRKFGEVTSHIGLNKGTLGQREELANTLDEDEQA